MFDPLLGRFLSPDPYVQMPDFSQNFNRYSYCLNNPLVYTDPSGELFGIDDIIIGAVIGAFVNLTIQGMSGNLHDGGDFLKAFAVGAVNGALSQISPIKIPLFGNSSIQLGIAPQIAVGTDGIGMGVNVSLGFKYKNLNAGINFGGTYYVSAAGTGTSGFEGRIGYGIGYKFGKFEVGIGSTYFYSGETTQQTGQMYARYKNYRATYENDTWALVPGLWSAGGASRDKFRTTAVRIDVMDKKLTKTIYNVGLNMFTGKSDGNTKNNIFQGSEVNKYRMGVIYAEYENMRIGYNSEKNIRGPIQNGFHDWWGYEHFEVLGLSDRFYGGYYSSNPYTLW
jgi:hypothetical protein